MKRILSLVLVLAMLMTLVPAAVASASEGTAMILPPTLEEVEAEAFAGDDSIATMVVPNTVTSIGARAFADCTGMKEITIASHSISIDNSAFDGCSSSLVFYTHDDSPARLWALSHGYVCESLDGDSDAMSRFQELLAHTGFDTSLLQDSTFGSCCLIVRTSGGHLPDISEYNPIDIYKSENNLYYVQFETESDTEDCFNQLSDAGYSVEPDVVGEVTGVTAQSVTMADGWASSDEMGFDVYAPYVASHHSGTVKIAVIDSGVSSSVWGGTYSSGSCSFVGGDAYNEGNRHGSKVASIISDCMGDAVRYAELLNIRVVTSDQTYRTSVIIQAIKLAKAQGADVINLSLGWDGVSPEISRQLAACVSSGILVVAAAGNGSGSVMFPANISGVLAVSALTYSNESGYRVNSRTGSISYTAPGSHLSTSAYSRLTSAEDTIGSAASSWSAPQIAAALALIRLDSMHTGSAVSVLNSVCDSLGLSESEVGHGLPRLDSLVNIPVTEITLANYEEGAQIPAVMSVGDDFMLTWTVLPADHTDSVVTISSDDTGVVTVKKYGTALAVVTARGMGEANVSVTCGGKTSQVHIVVTQPVTEISVVGAPEDHMIVGRTVQLTAEVLPANAADRTIAWKSSDESIATVDENGLVTGIAAGTVRITCEAQDGYGAYGYADITVIELPAVTALTLTSPDAEIADQACTMEVGGVMTIVPVIEPEEASQEVTYSVLTPGVISCESDGTNARIIAKKAGTAVVIAKAEGGTNILSYLTVTVVVSVTKVAVEAEETVLDIGDTTVVSATVLPSDATDASVTWTCEPEGIVTVSNVGIVRALASGSAVVTATAGNGVSDSVTITVRQPITVTLDANGGECEQESVSAFAGYEVGELPAAERTCYTFDGWYTEGGTLVTAESAFDADTTVYAHWTGVPYTVLLDSNDGTESDPAEMNGIVGSRLGALPTPERDYYIFTGWYTEDGTLVTADYVQQDDSTLSLTAHWDATPYRVTFNANGGTCGETERSVDVDTAVGTLPVPVRNSYTFAGWFTEEGEQIDADYVQHTTADLVLYANWTPNPYTVTFDVNAGNGACDEATRTACVDTAVGTLPVPTRAFYDFAGWMLEDGTPVTENYTQAADTDVTFLATWTPHTLAVTFDANEGTVETTELTATVDQPIGALPAPVRAYYDFAGWVTADGEKIDETYVPENDDDMLLTAAWRAHTYKVSFNANEGTCDTAEITGTVDQAIGTLPTPVRSCYTFKGWTTDLNNGTFVTADYVQATDDDLTLYAFWEPNEYTLVLDVNDGSGDAWSYSVKVGETFRMRTPTREYYTFSGWYIGDTLQGETYSQSTDADVTMTAHWTPLEYTMFFDVNGGSMSASSSAQKYVGTAVGTLPTPTREGYTFAGWTCSGSVISGSFVHYSTDTITVVASWTANRYTITLNGNGGTSTSMTVTYMSAVGTMPTSSRDYYTFAGWYTSADGGTQYTASTTCTTAGSITLYAHWTLNGYGSWSSWSTTAASAAYSGSLQIREIST